MNKETNQNKQIDLTGVTAVDDLEFLQLDPKYRKAHIVGAALVYAGIMAAALLLLLTDRVWICVAAEGAVLIAAAVNLSFLPKAYGYKGYALRERDISYRSGILFPKTTTIPFDRVQQVSVRQNPVSRYFGLCALEIVNGAQLMASTTIPGLTDETANSIKNLVSEKLRNGHD